ncbi:MAG: glycosyltransferase [Nanoarchaeota archaeon]|nr:glycosyltransferase [Nanoarchaeota archaeon]
MGVNTSIIITNHNYGKYLGRCIRSCLNQTMNKDEFEIIVVDDASKDNSRQVMDSFGGKIKKIFMDSNKGVSYASNQGIKEAMGMFVIRVDADDYINENTLQFMTQIMLLNPEVGFVYSDMFRVDEEGNKLERLNMRDLTNLFNHGAGIMFRKSHLETIGLYDAEIKNCEDFDLLIRYFRNFDGYHIKLPLYRYTRHENNMTNDKEDRKKWKKKVLSKNKVGEKRG